MSKKRRLLKDMRVRMWYEGIDPRAAWVSTSGVQASSMEASYDGGLTWGCGDWHSTLGDFVVRLTEAGIWIDKVTLVDQRNGRAGWTGQFEFTFKRIIPKKVIEKKTVVEEPPWVKEGLSNPVTNWVQKALDARQPVSEPDTLHITASGKRELVGIGDIKRHGEDPVTEALKRCSRPI